ncbi:hypothetical protein EON67_02470 [archaeon]|nr:MAG: hypothetical protein EON67_02470 [archaeon]
MCASARHLPAPASRAFSRHAHARTVTAASLCARAGRSWWWQVCTEFGWWQIAPATGSIRSANVSNAWYSSSCSKIFGLPAGHLPDVDATNAYYGGANIAGYNIFFSNGVEDPWRWAGVQKSLSSTEIAQVVDCDCCAHCVDLYTPTPQDAATLVAERAAVKALLNQWLSE